MCGLFSGDLYMANRGIGIGNGAGGGGGGGGAFLLMWRHSLESFFRFTVCRHILKETRTCQVNLEKTTDFRNN